MSRLSPDQLAAAAHQAGFRGQALVEAVAIAMAESGGNPNALNPRGEYSVGLMQMNMRAHGNRFGSERQLKDPVHNMRAAFQLSGGGKNFRPWSVHRSSPSPHAGASDRHLGTARSAVQRVTGGNVPHVPTGGGGSSSQPVPDRAAGIEAQEFREAQDHQNRMLEFMGMMVNQQQSRGRPAQVRSAVQVDERQFSPAGLTERLQRLQPQDLTPSVTRRPVQDRQMLEGIGRHIRQGN